MDGMQAPATKQQLAPTWEQIRIQDLVRVSIIPVLIATILLAALSIWRIKQPEAIGESQFVSIILIAHVILFAIMSGWYMRRLELTSPSMLVLMIFSGLITGLLVAIAKLAFDYHTFAILRIVGEPITTALGAAIVGYLAYWQLSKLIRS